MADIETDDGSFDHFLYNMFRGSNNIEYENVILWDFEDQIETDDSL
jgi:hypothetical protein